MPLKNITPPHLRCGFGQCPAVYLEDDGKHLRIIGKAIEGGIRIDRAYFASLGGSLSRLLMWMGL